MPVELQSPTLQQFLDLAAQSADNKTIRSKDELSSTSMPTMSSTNQKTMSDFLAAIKQEFGSNIADTMGKRLMAATDGGTKPLKAHMVRSTVDDAIRMVQHNINARDLYFSGMDSTRSFEADFQACCEQYKFTDPELKDFLRERVKEELRTTIPRSGLWLEPKDMKSRVNSSLAVGAAISMTSSIYSGDALPGTREDKFDLMSMLERDMATGMQQFLPEMRALQPEGRLKPETVWKVLIGSDMPQELTQAREFRGALNQALEDKLTADLGNRQDAQRMMTVLNTVKWQSAQEIVMTGRPVTQDDFIDPNALLGICGKLVREGRAEKKLAQDIGRMANADLSGAKADAGVQFHLPDGAATDVKFGGEALQSFAFSSEDAKRAYRTGTPSEMSAHVRKQAMLACQDNAAQADMLLALMTQEALKVFGAAGNVGYLGELIKDAHMNEHMATMYDVQPQADGSVLMTITSNEAASMAGRGKMVVSVAPDGSYQMQSCLVESPENVRAG